MIGTQKAYRLADILNRVRGKLTSPEGPKMDAGAVQAAFEEACFAANAAAPNVTEEGVLYPSYDLKFLRYPIADAQQAMVFEEAAGSERMNAVYRAAGLPEAPLPEEQEEAPATLGGRQVAVYIDVEGGIATLNRIEGAPSYEVEVFIDDKDGSG